jgi:hypothetical protein
MAKIEKDSRGAHGPEGSSGYYIHLAHRSGRAQLVYKVWHLLCGYDAGRAVANAFVDL